MALSQKFPLPQGWTVGRIETPEDPAFQDVLKSYDKIFTLPSEVKSQKLMANGFHRSADPVFQEKNGHCREMWVYIRDDKNNIVGASNFAVFADSVQGSGIDGTLQGIFSYVNPAYRRNARDSHGKDVLSMLFDLREAAGAEFIGRIHPGLTHAPRMLSFIEQNSPLLMTPQEYEEDSEAAKLDQIKRRTKFETYGFRQVNMRYIQPPLKREGIPCNFLDICVKGLEGNTISADVVREHLKRYFTLCFPTGTTLDDPTLAPMKNDLENNRGGWFTVLPPGRFETFAALAGIKTLLGATVQLPQSRRKTPLGEIFKAAAGRFYGADISRVGDMLPRAVKHESKEPDVLIIGAGFAGLKAAARLKKKGISYRLIEATGEAGGKAKTMLTESGLPVNLGPHWLHNGLENPLRKLLEKYGVAYTVDDAGHVNSYKDGKAHGAALRAQAAAHVDIEKGRRIVAGAEPDCALGDLVADKDARHAFCRKYTTWFGLDPDQHPSALEWLTDKDTPGGLQIEGGIKVLVDILAREAKLASHVLFNTPVTKITSTPEGVRVQTQDGETLTAKKAIVTVPHAVLKSGAIAFDPPLGKDMQEDFSSIATGRMTKIIVEVTPEFFRQKKIPPNLHVDLTDSDPPLYCHINGDGKPFIVMLVGGSKGEEIERMPPQEAMKFFSKNLRQVKQIEGYDFHLVGKPIITRWNTNPYSMGAFTAGLPGVKRSGPRVQDNLYFAGETYNVEFPGSVAGAYLSGKQAANMVIEALARDKKRAAEAFSKLPYVDRMLRSRGDERAVVLN